jgi:hypothetical protein
MIGIQFGVYELMKRLLIGAPPPKKEKAIRDAQLKVRTASCVLTCNHVIYLVICARDNYNSVYVSNNVYVYVLYVYVRNAETYGNESPRGCGVHSAGDVRLRPAGRRLAGELSE